MTVRTTAEINANIDAINSAAETSGTAVSGAELNILTLESRAAAAIEKFEKAKREYESQAAVRGIEVGHAVSLVFGRALNKKVLSGNVLSVEEEATGLQFTVLTGIGKDSKVVTVGADSILLDADAVAAAEADIAAFIAANPPKEKTKAE